MRELSDQAWERVLARDPVAALRCGRQVDALPRGGPGELAENVSFAAASLPKLAGIAGLQAAFLRDHLEHELAEEHRFWYRLPVTPYNALPLGFWYAFGHYGGYSLIVILGSAVMTGGPR